MRASERKLKLKLEQNPTQVPLGTFAFTFGPTLIDGINVLTFRKKGNFPGSPINLKKKLKTSAVSRAPPSLAVTWHVTLVCQMQGLSG